jgi:hypothetical protein
MRIGFAYPPSPPRSLRDLFDFDCHVPGFLSLATLLIDTSAAQFKVQIGLTWGPNCGPTTMRCCLGDTPAAAALIAALLSSIEEALKVMDAQVQMPTKAGCDAAPTSPPHERFSGEVFIYSEMELPASDVDRLKALYDQRGFSLQVFGPAYLSQQVKDWPEPAAEDAEPNHEAVVFRLGIKERS